MKWRKVGDKTPKIDKVSRVSETLMLYIPNRLDGFFVGWYGGRSNHYYIGDSEKANPTHWAYINPPKQKETPC